MMQAPSARARCAEQHRRLLLAGSSDVEIKRALENLAADLADLIPSAVGDIDTALRIGDIRTMVEAHLLAGYQLEVAGTDPARTDTVLRRAYRQACIDLALLNARPTAR